MRSIIVAACQFSLLLLVANPLLAADASTRFAKARENFQKGRYEEAAEDLERLAKENLEDPTAVDTAVLHSETLLAQGDRATAEKLLTESLKRHPSAKVHGQLAKLYFDLGRYDAAEREVSAALEAEPDQLQARLIKAHLLTEKGELKKADQAYRWFVAYYNQHEVKEAEPQVLIAEGASQYALWNNSRQVLDFCVNTVTVDALKADKLYWQAHLVSGRLLLEKYNKAQGPAELKAALAINPNAAQVHIELAKAAISEFNWDEVEQEANRALEICPHSPGALQAIAVSKLYFRDLEAAEKLLMEALTVNPVDSESLAVLAALRMLQDGWPDATRWKQLLDHLDHLADLKLENPTRCEQILIDVARRNPRPGIFLTALAEVVDMFRQHTIAEPLLKQAILLMPQLSQPKNALGQLYMQTGQIDDAKRTLDEAFKSDPYHVRVSNMRKVIRVLDDYESTTTEHFVVRADGKLDKLLARYMAEYLEEIYPELTALFQFEPPARTQIEIYNTAKGLSGHQWFSARMVGLPWVQTIGASTGVIIAMQSPGSMEQPLNWARVLKHEFVHVLTLQQTNFNIPHWYTEALAVRSEGYPQPVEWNKLLLNRVPKRELKNLDNLTMGFIRAGNQENWNFAYCQSLLYAEYMVERFGEKSLAQLLEAYRRNETTSQAVPVVFGVDKADFEAGYLQYLDKVVAGIKKGNEEADLKPSQIEKAYEKDKTDPQAAANYARLMLLSRNRDEAKKVASQVLKTAPSQPVAAAVLGFLLLREDKFDEAAKVLEPALNQEQPHKSVLDLLMKARLKQKRADDALHLCELGKQHFPYDSDWWKGIAAASKLTGDTARRRDALESLVLKEADDPAPRKALAEMALADRDFPAAFKFAKLALHIDVLDADIHRILAESSLTLNDRKRAIDEYETALELKPKDQDIQLGLAEAYMASDRANEAKTIVDTILKNDAENQKARQLSDRLRAANQ